VNERLGQYTLDEIYVGECRELMAYLPDNCIDLVFTSPPYYNAREYAQFASYSEYLAFLKSFLISTLRVLKKDCPLVLNVSPVIVPRKSRQYESKRLPIPFDAATLAQQVGFQFVDDIIWVKPDGASSRAIKFAHHRRPVAYKPFAVTEYLLVFRPQGAPLIDMVIRRHTGEQIKASLVQNGYERTNVWEIAPETRREHPAPFPEALAERVVRYYSYVGDVVLDPMAGSGTTCKAAKQLGRQWLGFDISPKYVEFAQRRVGQS